MFHYVECQSIKVCNMLHSEMEMLHTKLEASIGHAPATERNGRYPADDMASDAEPRGGLGTVRNAVLLLRLLGEAPAYVSLRELSELAGMAPPTVHRVLRSLVIGGLVQQDPRSSRYGLGPELIRLSEHHLAHMPVLRVIAPYLAELRDQTKATVLVALLVGDSVLYADRVDGEDAGGMLREGRRVYPALATAAGRLLLANAGEGPWEAAVQRADPGTAGVEDRSHWDRSVVVMAPSEVRIGYEVAVPVRGRSGQTVAALAATGSPTVFSQECFVDEIAPQLVRVARVAGPTLPDA
jgi:IclR family acetate operon transcriptional repressor